MAALIALGSFAVGVMVGVVLIDALELIQAARKEKPVSPVPTESRRERIMWRTLLIAAIALQVVVGVMLIVTRDSAEEYARCTASWQQQFAQGYGVRAEAAAEVGKAIDDILLAANAGDRAAMRTAVDRYVDLRKSQDADRAKNPLPPLPESICGKASEVRR